MQPVRGWTDEAWDDAQSRLATRGWVAADGMLTSAGREAHAAVEDATDRAASRPWARLGPEATAEIAAALTPLARACATVLPYPSPIGLPAPGAAAPRAAGSDGRVCRSPAAMPPDPDTCGSKGGVLDGGLDEGGR
jgi:hypothetical protein